MVTAVPSRRQFLRLVLLASGSGLLAACAPRATAPQQPAADSKSGSATPKRGGVLRIVSAGDPPHMDPFDTPVAGLAINGPGGALIYSRLLRYEHRPDVPDMASIPRGDLAERWEQPDPTTYVFHLRQGVKFHDVSPVNGRELVADDVVYSYDRQRERGRPNAGQLASIDKIEAVDKYTVRITLKAPDSDFLIDLADGHNVVVAREAVELRGDLKDGPAIGTGPFILEKYEKGTGTFLTRNPNYFEQPLPYVDRIEIYSNFTDEAATVAAFRAGRIDMLDVTPEDREAVAREQPQVQVDTFRVPSTQLLVLKHDRPPFNDVRVRQAISKALDRQQFTDAAWGGRGWLHAGLIIGGEFLLPEPELKQYYQRDVEGARKLLADAGYPSGFEMEVLVGPLRPGDVPTAELIAAQLKDINVIVKLQVLDYARFTQQVTTRGEFNQAAYGPGSSLNTANAMLMARFHSEGARNVNALKDPVLDRMIMAQASELDPAKRKQQLHEIQRYILDNALLIVTHANETDAVLAPYVRNWMGWKGYDGIKYSYVWLDK